GAPGQQPVAPRPPDIGGAGTSFRGARGNFSRFANTGSSSSLGRAMASYIRSGTGGARRASRRMGSSQVAARGILGIVRDIQQLGPEQLLRQLNLGNLAGQPAADVFVALMEFICPPGGAVDEGIARQAMVETIADMADAGVGSFDTLTREQLNDVFLDFIVHSIEGRVMADMGGRGITLPNDVAAVEHMQDQLHDFVSGATRGQLAGRLDGVANLSDRDIEVKVNQIYETAFDLIAAAGEEAE
uniref:Qat anti-phage system associated protein QatB n=8 Tax=Pseudomonas aeruginosa TaxID=287 RepID=UPI001ABC4D1E